MKNKIYSKLMKAQDMCFNASENKLFDMCDYHLDLLDAEELTNLQLKKILIFAEDVYKIAKLKNNLNPLV